VGGAKVTRSPLAAKSDIHSHIRQGSKQQETIKQPLKERKKENLFRRNKLYLYNFFLEIINSKDNCKLL
jgi:hypothetical protein